jgi:drug/metabolite transporter (DMT)-like permease
VCSYIDPAASLILSALLLHERMDWLGLVGTALILGSAIVSQWPAKVREE